MWSQLVSSSLPCPLHQLWPETCYAILLLPLSAGIKGMRHHAWQNNSCFKHKKKKKKQSLEKKQTVAHERSRMGPIPSVLPHPDLFVFFFVK